MTFILNEWDVENGVHDAAIHSNRMPVYQEAAVRLERFVNWVNQNSDGWPYWRPANRAAVKLQEVVNEQLQARYRTSSTARDDSDPAALKRALTPIKSFLTGQGADWREVLG